MMMSWLFHSEIRVNSRDSRAAFRALLPAVLTSLAFAAVTPVHAKPYVDGEFRGRIAWSADGNHNDPDDWIASPMALAIFAEMGLKDRLVHFDYNCILPQTNPEWEKIHAASVLGAAERWGYDRSRFIDCRQRLDDAVASIARAINESSEDNPLYFIVAGPMEVPYRGIQKSDPAKRKFVYCISHSRWNEGFSTQYKFTFTKRGVIEQDVHWVQIRDQNRLLAAGQFGKPSPPEEFSAYFWMRDAREPRVQFLWERMVVSTRPDPSDAGMAWFAVTGDEDCTPEKLRALLLEHHRPTPAQARTELRLEAENFRTFEGYAIEHRNDRNASHRLNVALPEGVRAGRVRTRLDEPFADESGRYDVEVRFLDEKTGRASYALFLNGVAVGERWESSGEGRGWSSHTIRDVTIRQGDEVRVDATGAFARLDYVQLTKIAKAVSSARSAEGTAGAAMAAANPSNPAKLDDPAAMPGGLIVAGSNPGYLKYNGGKPVFLAGPDDPEAFLYMGALNPDGTRSGGGQSEIIRRIAASGANAFHCQIFRMQRCNTKKEGDDTHCPFVSHDPSQPLNPKVLDQWDGWLTEFERAGINVHFEFYNDATDVELMGWTLDVSGNLHADEQRFIAGIIERFKHHKNLLWGIEESSNKIPRARVPHFRKIGELIARTDNFHHPIVQSFVVHDDPEGDFPKVDPATTDDYVGDPHIRVVTWLHVMPHEDDLERAHQEYLRYGKLDGGRFVTMKNETFYKAYLQRRPLSRQYIWAAAMAGLHVLEAQHKADRGAHLHLMQDDGRLRSIMEETDFFRMRPHDELAAGTTKWVLANPGESYLAYSHAARDVMGVTQLVPGAYELVWFDLITGERQAQKNMRVTTPSTTWLKPPAMNQEIALYVKRVGDLGAKQP